MNLFINFTRDGSHPDRSFAGGLPLFDGKMPSRFRSYRGVMVDGEPVEFVDETIPERLHKALVDGPKLGRRAFDCLTFAALMFKVPMGRTVGGETFKFEEQTEKRAVRHNDTNVASPLNLGGVQDWDNLVAYTHTVVPAHGPTTARYVHRLGTQTLCFSTLPEAMRLYEAAVAHPMRWIEFEGQERFEFNTGYDDFTNTNDN